MFSRLIFSGLDFLVIGGRRGGGGNSKLVMVPVEIFLAI
jgi:hypothetical protein